MNYVILDFDGVINVLHDGVLNDWETYHTYKLPYCNVKISDNIIEWLNRLSQQDNVTVLWLSSWLDDTVFFNILGIPIFHYIGDSYCIFFESWKTEYLDSFISTSTKGNDKIIWIEDEEDMSFIDNKYSNVYCFKTDSNRGITADIVNQVNDIIE